MSKTTIAGILTIIIAVGKLLLTFVDGDPATVAGIEDFALALGLSSAGAVGIAAADQKKS